MNRHDFPLLNQKPGQKPLTYLDSGATAQKPRVVLEAMNRFYTEQNANVHRGAYALSAIATEAYESVRRDVARYLGQKPSAARQVVFTRGTTSALNLVARSIGEHLRPGDHVLITRMEHHGNFVPWQQAAQRSGATLDILELTAEGRLDLEQLDVLLSKKPKVFAFTHVSNVLGTINPVSLLASRARAAGVKTIVVDGAQRVPHGPISDSELGDIDFYAFSGHKLFGPTGVGVLFGTMAALETLTPSEFGGDMILRVTDAVTQFNEIPYRFEAGTPPIAEVIGLGAAIRYVEGLDLNALHTHESELTRAGLSLLSDVPGLTLFGPKTERVPIFTFVLDGVHPHDLATFLDSKGIAIRGGHHCAQPLLNYLKVPATARASTAFYNDVSELELLTQALREARAFFKRERGGR